MKCPSDTRDLVNRDQISNFALRYQYFLNCERNGNEKVKFSIDSTDSINLGDSQEAIDSLRDRQTNQLNYLIKSYRHFCEFYQVDWRMITGLGAEHVQETNMTLDHVYGIPYIPGSAFKGIVRSWVIQEVFGNDEKLATRDIQPNDSPDLQENKKNFFDTFGSQEVAGKVRFLPAYPIGNVSLSLDIMNPHFPNYYVGTELPTDTQNPVPINFLTVEKASYRFVILAKEQVLIDTAKDWVDTALKDRGLGAKTAVGYGYFRPALSVQNKFKPNTNFEIPLGKRPPRPQQISLDEAYEQFNSNNPNPNPQLIDITSVKNCVSQLAQVATRKNYIELNQLAGIHSTLVIVEEDLVEISDFGKWIWNNLKASLLSSRILELPRLVYTVTFRKTLKKLLSDELVRLQEELIEVSNQLEEGDGGLASVEVPEHLLYTREANEGALTFSGINGEV